MPSKLRNSASESLNVSLLEVRVLATSCLCLLRIFESEVMERNSRTSCPNFGNFFAHEAEIFFFEPYLHSKLLNFAVFDGRAPTWTVPGWPSRCLRMPPPSAAAAPTATTCAAGLGGRQNSLMGPRASEWPPSALQHTLKNSFCHRKESLFGGFH